MRTLRLTVVISACLLTAGCYTKDKSQDENSGAYEKVEHKSNGTTVYTVPEDEASPSS